MRSGYFVCPVNPGQGGPVLKEEGSPVGRPPAGALGGGVRRENSLLERERYGFLRKNAHVQQSLW